MLENINFNIEEKEKEKEREKRKNIYISYVLAHAKGVEDYKALIEEAIEKWEQNNKKDN